MNTLLRTLLINLLLLIPAVIRAENWQTFELHASAGMTGRGVSVNGSHIGTFSLSQWQWWTGSNWVTNGEAVLGDVQIDIDQAGPLIFESGGWQAEISIETLQGSVGSPGMLQLEFVNAGVPVVELLLPMGYAGSYSLAVVQLDDEGAPVLTPVSYSGEVSGTSLQGQAYAWQRAVAPRDPSRSFYIRNLTTSMRSPSDFVHLGATTWTPDGETPAPLVSVTFYLDPAHSGYSFTLHYQCPGQPEMVQSLTAWPSGVGGSQMMGDWQMADVTGSVSVTGSIAWGSSYWLTLDASNQTVSPTYTLDPAVSYPNPLQWSLYGPTTPPPPPPSLQTIEFYVPSGMTGGYVHQPSAERELSGAVSSGFIEDYDAEGYPHFFYYDVRTAEIDPNEPFWLEINGTELSQGETWHYDGWSPIGGPFEPPPPQTTVSGTLILPQERQYHTLTLTAPNGSSLGLEPWSWWGTSQWITLNDPWHGAWGTNVNTIERQFEMTFEGDPVNFSGGLTLTDESTGESQGVGQGGADLSQWWLLPVEQSLQISLSRWGHDLRLRQRHGEEYSITPGASQGDLTLLDGSTWYQSYYYFDALSLRRPHDVLDWWVYDADTGEESPWNQTDLINWIALMPVEEVSATRSSARTVTIAWQVPGFADPNGLHEGGFTIERRANNGAWSQVATGAVASFEDSSNPGSFEWQDAGLVIGPSYRYRVAYYYGSPPRRSAWVESGDVAFPLNGDWDGDGMSDAWEIANGFAPDNPNDANGDWDNDGWTNLEEFLAGTNPLQAPQDDPNGANVKLIVFTRLE